MNQFIFLGTGSEHVFVWLYFPRRQNWRDENNIFI